MRSSKFLLVFVLTFALYANAQQASPDASNILGYPHPDVDRFQSSVVSLGPYMVLRGAHSNDDCLGGSVYACGSAHIYKYDQGQWTLQQDFLFERYSWVRAHLLTEDLLIFGFDAGEYRSAELRVYRRGEGTEFWQELTRTENMNYRTIKKIDDQYVGVNSSRIDLFDISATGQITITDSFVNEPPYTESSPWMEILGYFITDDARVLMGYCPGYRCEGEMKITEFDVGSQSVVSELTVSSDDYPQKKAFSVADGDIIVDAYSSSGPVVHKMPVYRKTGDAWAYDHEISISSQSGYLGGSPITGSDGTFVQRRDASIGGEYAHAAIIFEKNQSNVWQEVGVARIRSSQGMVRYVTGVHKINNQLVLVDNNGPDPEADLVYVLSDYQDFMDYDKDGLPSGWEIQFGFAPDVFDDPTLDADGDFVSNAEEFVRQLSPIDDDTDSDGMPDGWELQYSLDPLLTSDGTQDKDGDRVSNRQEFVDHTDPTNSLSFLERSLPMPPASNSGGGGGGGGAPGPLFLLLLTYSLATRLLEPKK